MRKPTKQPSGFATDAQAAFAKATRKAALRAELAEVEVA
jgi:hypothetical protein